MKFVWFAYNRCEHEYNDCFWNIITCLTYFSVSQKITFPSETPMCVLIWNGWHRNVWEILRRLLRADGSHTNSACVSRQVIFGPRSWCCLTSVFVYFWANEHLLRNNVVRNKWKSQELLKMKHSSLCKTHILGLKCEAAEGWSPHTFSSAAVLTHPWSWSCPRDFSFLFFGWTFTCSGTELPVMNRFSDWFSSLKAEHIIQVVAGQQTDLLVRVNHFNQC